jgi:hypothetical protein
MRAPRRGDAPPRRPQEILTDDGKVLTGRFGAKDTEVLFDRMDLPRERHRTPADGS